MGKFTGLSFGATFWVNLLRGMVTGIVWVIIMLVTKGKMPGMSIAMQLMLSPLVGIVLMLVFLPFYLIGSLFGIGGVVSFAGGLAMLPGDPIMYLLHKIKPSLVPVKKYSFLEFSLFMLIYKGDLPEIKKEENLNSSKDTSTCPRAGKVLAKGDVTAFGSSWKSAEVMMIIRPDWHVTDKNGKKIGWIGTDDEIRDQAEIGDFNPNETLRPFSGNVIAKVRNDTGIWVGNENVGEIVTW